MEQGAKRLLIDCTHTLTYGLKTGVQRVVRSIIREAKRLEIQLGVEVVPIIVDGNSFRKVDTDTWTDPALNEPLDFLKHVPMWYKLCAKQLCRLVPNARLRRWLLLTIRSWCLRRIYVSRFLSQRLWVSCNGS